MKRADWAFSDYIEEIVAVCELAGVPGMAEKRDILLREVWARFPDECEQLGLVEV